MLLKFLERNNKSLTELIAWVWLFGGFILAWCFMHLFPDSSAQQVFLGDLCKNWGNTFFWIFGVAWFIVSFVIQLIILPPLRILFTIDERLDNVAKKCDVLDFNESSKEKQKTVVSNLNGDAFRQPLTLEDFVGEKRGKFPLFGVLAGISVVLAGGVILADCLIKDEDEQGEKQELVKADNTNYENASESHERALRELEMIKKRAKEHRENAIGAAKGSTSETSMTDSRDGNVYETVNIGNQVWLAENLRFHPHGSSPYQYSCYDAEFGCRYSQKIAPSVCPSGWRLPNNEDWKDLINYAKENVPKKKAAAIERKLHMLGFFQSDFCKGDTYLDAETHTETSEMTDPTCGTIWSSSYRNNLFYHIYFQDPDIDGYSYELSSKIEDENIITLRAVRCVKE